MDYFTYILKCSDGSYYTGHTEDLEKRIADHQAGILSGYTTSRLPVQLVFSEIFDSREKAYYAEHQIKGWSRRKKEALISGNFELLVQYAKCKSQV